jgi:hypothetical protein
MDGDLSGRSEKTDGRENSGKKRYKYENVFKRRLSAAVASPLCRCTIGVHSKRISRCRAA